MNKNHLSVGAAWLFTLVLVGCESDGGIAARTREKSSAFATLHPWEKRFIGKGVVAAGFTPDMVYMAMGDPAKVETKDSSKGRLELWTYPRYYPYIDAVQGFRFAPFTTESAYQPQMATRQTNLSQGDYALIPSGATMPTGMDRKGGESAFYTSGPQGGSMEPANLQSYTMQVLFQNGKVARMAAMPNFN